MSTRFQKLYRVLIFAAAVWALHMTSGLTATRLTHPSTTQSQLPSPLRFPVSGYTAYDAPISSVFDHHMSNPYGRDGTVTAYTGASGDRDSCQGTVYAQAGGQPFDFGQRGHYVGVRSCGGSARLSYDGHPGIDYAFTYGTAIYPAISGRISYSENAAGANAATYHVLTIDPMDGSGYRIHYLHLSSYLNTTPK